LRGAPVSFLQGPVGQLQRGLEPPFHIQHDPREVGVCLNRFDDEIPADAVEEFLDVEINYSR
jgi:hypothetical protein